MNINIALQKADIKDAEQIHKMQIAAFAPILKKYQDYDTSPAAESIDRVRNRFEHPLIIQYFIVKGKEKVGVIRIRMVEEDSYKLVQILILPQFQNKGYAQKAIKEVENLFPQVKKWELDTIKQDNKLCYLYEKMGYVKTGQIKNIKKNMDLVFYEKK